MIKERYCSFEVSKLLREKGFKESTQFVWYEHLPSANAAHNSEIGKPKRDYFYWNEEEERNSSWTNDCPVPSYISGDVYSCPTHQMAMDWLREIHGIFIEHFRSIDLNGNYHYSYNVLDSGCKYLRKGYTSFDWRYQDAVEDALEYCLTELMKGGED